MRVSAFLIGLVAGWAVTTLMLVLNAAEPWAILSGWLTFFAVTTAIVSTWRGRPRGHGR